MVQLRSAHRARRPIALVAAVMFGIAGCSSGSSSTTSGGAAEEVIEMQGLDGIVSADAMSRGHLTKARCVFGFCSGVSAVEVGFAHKVIVRFGRDDVIGGEHESV